MLDSCSMGTFVLEDLRRELKLDGVDSQVLIKTMNGQQLHNVKVLKGLTVSDLDGNNSIVLPKAFTKTEMPATDQDIPTPELTRKWPHLTRIADRMHPFIPNAKIGLLIGTNCPKAIEPMDFVTSMNGGPFAVQTFAGWTVIGPHHVSTGERTTASCNRIVAKEIDSERKMEHHFTIDKVVKEIISPEALNRMMEIDFNQRKVSNEHGHSQEDKLFLKKVEQRIRQVEGHYEIPLPFREDDVVMPDNRAQAEQRAHWIKKKFAKNNHLHSQYAEFMNGMIAKDYAREVPPDLVKPKQGKVWYLPHHTVYHPKKPDKVRVVFDCSARFEGISLNDKLLQGSDLTSSLVGVLLRFRQESVTFMGDIESMFYQVRIPEDQRDFVRYLWWPNGDLSQGLFGAVSSPTCSNFNLRRAADDCEEEIGIESADVLRRNFYVDDCLRSDKTGDIAIERMHGVIRACAQGDFHLTKLTSNDKMVLDTIPNEERTKELRNLDLSHDSLPIERGLGVHWQVESDELGFRITIIGSIYDPLGIAAPVLLPGKKILQDLCREKIDWDDEISDAYRHRWEEWRRCLPLLEKFSIDRCLKPDNFGKVVSQQTHSFSDASSTGYGQVSYLRQENDKGEIHCSFLMGKARLAPIKQITIPRLELTAAVLSVRVADMLIREFDDLPDAQFY